jgi:heptaprenyl diphosphate synthase
MGTTTNLDLRPRLSEVEERLREVLGEHHGATHLIDAGGKRLRPLLVILSAEFGPCRDKVVDAAVLTELIHVGTLHHDDVMDGAPVRHGVPTANMLWGNNRAVLLGDLMLARAAELGADLGMPALRLQTTTLARLVRGQLMETMRPRSADPMAFCLEVMADKSASLFAMATELGARVAAADDAVCAALHTYGEHLGIAFQLVDDVLDIVGAESGKTPGTDLRAGVVTVPVLHALSAAGAAADRLRVILVAGPVTDPDLHAEALTLLRDGPGPARTRADARHHAELARAALSTLVPGSARDALEGLCDTVLERAV